MEAVMGKPTTLDRFFRRRKAANLTEAEYWRRASREAPDAASARAELTIADTETLRKFRETLDSIAEHPAWRRAKTEDE